MEETLTKENQVAKIHLSQRKSTRVDIKLPVRFTDMSGQFKHGKTKNISFGGVYICTNITMPVGIFTDLCIDLPGDSPILVYGQVVWTNRYGFGVKFMSLENGDKQRLRALIRNNGKILL